MDLACLGMGMIACPALLAVGDCCEPCLMPLDIHVLRQHSTGNTLTSTDAVVAYRRIASTDVDG
jgi:hypothetical protein